jgi:hypothetical protein
MRSAMRQLPPDTSLRREARKESYAAAKEKEDEKENERVKLTHQT